MFSQIAAAWCEEAGSWPFAALCILSRPLPLACLMASKTWAHTVCHSNWACSESERGTINSFAGTTGVPWDSPWQARTYGHLMSQITLSASGKFAQLLLRYWSLKQNYHPIQRLSSTRLTSQVIKCWVFIFLFFIIFRYSCFFFVAPISCCKWVKVGGRSGD